MQWFAFGGYSHRPFVGFGSRTDAVLLQEYFANKQCRSLKFKEIDADLAARAIRQIEVVDISDRLIDIAIAEEVDHGDYDFEKEDELEV